MSSGNTDRQLQFMEDLGSTVLCCTPSYAAYLAESIHERGLRDKIHLKAGIFGAEAWSEQMRQDIQKSLGIKAYDIYGLTELSGPGVAYECSAQAIMADCEPVFVPLVPPEFNFDANVLEDAFKQGAYFVLADIGPYMRKGESDVDFCLEMAEKVGVACVPGTSFFNENINHIVRVHFAKKDETLYEALERLSHLKEKMG